MEFQFGAWLPDVRDYKNPGLEECVNALPGSNGYQPAREPASEGVNIPGTIIGAGSAYLIDGSSIVVVATTADLYVIRTDSATASSLGLSLNAADRVAFEQFGTAIYASTKNGDTWVLDDIQTDDTFSVSAGSPPSANCLGRVSDFLLMGDLTDIDANEAPYRVRWSRFNDPQGAWGTDIAAQAGAVDLDPAFGPITAITGGTFGVVFQRQGISRFTYTGGSTVFRRDTFEKNRGCVAPGSAVRVGETTYYIAHDGFFATDGTSPQPISTGRVWQWFSERVNQALLKDIVGAIDFQGRRIVWLWPSAGSDSFSDQLWYNWETDQWGYARQSLQWAVQAAKSGLTLEEVGALYPNIGTMPISLDSATFQPSGRALKVFSGGDLSELTGDTLGSTFQTGDMQPYTGNRTFVRSVTPIIETDRASVRVGTKERMTTAFTEVGPVDMGPIGFAPMNADGRYFRTIIEVPAGEEWRDAWGYQLDVSRAGAT